MVADGTITPFDAPIKRDMKAVMEQSPLLADLVAKFQWNKKNPKDGEALTEPELALMVLCTELVASTVARQVFRINQERKPK